MDYALLRSWLGLPPGPWPPNHYALLSLEVGHCDPAEVETFVLARMDRLRMHQLLHPELVTEGMNRLAQALICLTDPVARAAHDAELQTEEPEPPADDVLVVPFAPGLAPPEAGPPPDLNPDTYGMLPNTVTPQARPSPIEERAIVAEPIALPAVDWQPRTRRELFGRLAAMRRMLAAWRKLKPVLVDPDEPLARPAAVLTLLEAVGELQLLVDQLESVIANTGGSGTLALMMVRQRFVLPTFRTLLPEQRSALSLDWRRAELAFIREHDRLRELVRTGRLLQRRGQRTGKFIRWVARTPEVLWLVLAIATVVLAVLRSRHEP
ncbi:MAG: hypothetical protein K8U57_10240 [Planctomycetes bacterium]|nr:hypothetical protein [Planctomycetota bacterium]